MDSSRSTHADEGVVPVHVAVGVLRRDDDKIFIHLRETDAQGELWEFPGGKLEDGETPPAALRRELHEEIGVDVLAAEWLTEIQHQYTRRFVHLHVFLVTDYAHDPHGKEGQAIRWVTLGELKTVRLPGANQRIVALL